MLFFLLFILLVHFCISLCLIVGYPLAFAMLICLSIWEQVHFKFELMQETLYLMVTLLDQYLSQVTIKKDEMQLVGLTALLLASKYEDFWHPRVNINISTFMHFSWFAFLCSTKKMQVKELISISAESYTRDQVLRMVCVLLFVRLFGYIWLFLGMRLFIAVLYRFLFFQS